MEVTDYLATFKKRLQNIKVGEVDLKYQKVIVNQI